MLVGDTGQHGSVARGDALRLIELLLQANAGGLINGELVEVARVENSTLHLKDGRVLPSHYRSFTHGYAITSQAAQGQTVDQVIVVASGQSPAAVHKEQFYVSISRGREVCRIFTDDRERLRTQTDRSSHRLGAVEVIHRRPSRRREFIARAIRCAQQLLIRLRSLTVRQPPAHFHETNQQVHRPSIRV